ncbi:MAG TPA: cytochrome C, partial [Bacteroidota bacterium]|nr:cytochrome C [Bacteroidota bacterium]
MDILRPDVSRAGALLALLLLSGPAARAQISPGELSSPHASLEGMGNCTRCHDLGKEVANAKCLECHTELRTRVNAGKGFHAGLTAKQCAECHSEHHGRNFTLIRFDRTRFNHDGTGFALEGKHRPLECARCHAQEHITAKDVRANRALLGSGTFMGLPADCNGCHADRHRGQLALECRTCHTTEGWKPAARFVHDRAKYRLTGKHVLVECARCHKPLPDDVHTVKYSGIAFDRCSSCHADPHRGRFQKPCESCHATSGWETGAARNFDHAATKF